MFEHNINISVVTYLHVHALTRIIIILYIYTQECMHAIINKKERTCDIERDSICTVQIRRNLTLVCT